MDPVLLRSLLLRLQAIEGAYVGVRLGVVTIASPLAVTLGGATVAYTNVKAVGGYSPVVGDLVTVASYGSDLLVLGQIGPTVGAPTLTNGWANMGGSYAALSVTRQGRLVTLAGSLNGLAATTVNAFTVPVGFRPAATVAGAANYWSGTNRLIGTVYVASSGIGSLYGGADVFTARDYFNLNLTYPV